MPVPDRPATLLKKRPWHRYFLCEFCKISKNTFFYRVPLVAASECIRNTIEIYYLKEDQEIYFEVNTEQCVLLISYLLVSFVLCLPKSCESTHSK